MLIRKERFFEEEENFMEKLQYGLKYKLECHNYNKEVQL